MNLTYGHLKNPQFLESFQKLVACPMKSAKVAYTISRTAQTIGNELKTLDAAWKSLVTAHAEKDADGKLVRPDDAPEGVVKIPDAGMEAFNAAADEFMKISFAAKGRKLKIEEIEDAKLSAQDLLVLEDLIEVSE